MFRPILLSALLLFTTLASKAQTPATVSANQFQLVFGPQGLGITSAIQTVTFTNNGPTLGAFNLSISGPNAGDFGFLSCASSGTSLPTGSTCTVQVAFGPKSGSGSRTAALSFGGQFSGSPVQVQLQGLAEDPSISGLLQLSSTSLNASTTSIGNSSPLSLTITNVSPAPIMLLFSQITGSNAADFSLNLAQSTCQPALLLETNPASCNLNIAFSPTATGPRSATLVINSAVGALNVTLTGTALPAIGTVSLSASSLNFGTSPLQTTSLPKVISLIDSSTSPAVTISNFTFTGPNAADFSVAPRSPQPSSEGSASFFSCADTLAVPCSIPIIFTPHGTGLRQAVLTITDTDAASPHSVLLSGTGANTTNSFVFEVPAVPVNFVNTGQVDYGQWGEAGNMLTVDFGAPVLGFSTAAAGTITNTGTGTLKLSEAISGANASDFTLNPADSASDCANSSTLAAGASCPSTIGFKPAAAGVETALLTITDSNSGESQLVPLQGVAETGTKLITFADCRCYEELGTSHSFGSLVVGTSLDQRVFLQNIGTEPVTLTGAWFGLGNGPDFKITSYQCSNAGSDAGYPPVLQPNGTCLIDITFTPSGQGYRTSTLNITTDSPSLTATLPLSGVGLPQNATRAVSPVSVDFGYSPVGTPVNSGVITFNNYGSAPITLSGMTITGPNAKDFQVYNSNCGAIFAAGATCTAYVQFTPSVSGPEFGYLYLANNSPIGPILVVLQGIGQAVNKGVVVSEPPVADIADVDGNSATSQLFVWNTGDVPLSILNLSITGPDAAAFTAQLVGGSFFNPDPPLVNPGDYSNVLVSYTPFQTTSPATSATASLLITTTAGTLTVPLLASYPILTQEFRAAPVSLSAKVGSTVSFNEQVYPIGTIVPNISPFADPSPLVLDTPAIIGPNASQFSVTGSTFLPYSFAVTFTPAALGVQTASISFNNGTFLIPITGTGN